MNHINQLLILLFCLSLTISGKHNKKKSKPRIIEGQRADQSDFPFIASLQYKDDHMCGGSIISESIILTAAHCCIDASVGRHFRLSHLSAAVGSSKWKTGRKFKISEMIVHDRYDPDRIENDVALWKLESRLRASRDNIKKVNLFMSRLNDHSKVYATVVGWGLTSRNGKLIYSASDDLMMVEIYSLTKHECMQYYDVGDGNICFSSVDRRGSCQGDSGGPLVMQRDGDWMQIGLVSYGGDCNNTAPEVYTRISAYYDWIKTNAYSYSMKSKKKKVKKY